MFSSDGREWIWRFKGEEFDPDLIDIKIKHSQSIMIWCSISYSGVGSLVFIEKKMDKYLFLRILKNNLLKDAERLIGDDFYFQQDNDPKHKSDIVQDWIIKKGIDMIKWPANSPDMSPIENCFHFLKKSLGSNHFTSKDDFKEKILKNWKEIPLDYLRNLYNSMEDHIESLHRAKGHQTKF